MAELETPDDPESIYLARDDEIGEYRLIFMGDIYRRDDGHLVMILQHPCALRQGVELNPKLLVAPVKPDTLRSDWAKFTIRRMPLPKLIGDQDHSANFADLELIQPSTLSSSTRIAVLSQFGVNLLMQRWVYHNTRLTVPTHTYSDSTIGPFDEADLIEEWVMDRVEAGADSHAAEQECAAWLDVKVNSRQRRSLLTDAQYASSVRRDARAHRKSSKLVD